MTKTKLAQAIATVITGVTLSIASDAVTAAVTYNYASQVNGNAKNGAGTWTNGVATGYTGNLPVDWVVSFQTDNESYVLSSGNARTDGAPETYNLSVLGHRWNPASSWGNALDFGLISLPTSSNLTIRVQGDTGSEDLLPGFTLWQGWDTAASSSKHGAWNANPYDPGNRGAAGIGYLGHASTNSSDQGVNYSYDNGAVEITFANLAAGNYSLWIGGNGTATSSFNYVATLTAAPVPIPAAVWLFGSALAGLGVIGRRKDQAQTLSSPGTAA